MKIIFITLSVIFAIGLVIFSHKVWFAPTDFHECIVQGMQGVQSDVAAATIRTSCKQKFASEGKRTPTPQKIPLEAQNLLTVKAALSPSGLFHGNIYNRNADWIITSITVDILARKTLGEILDDIEEKPAVTKKTRLVKIETYNIKTLIFPYTIKPFQIFVSWPVDEPYTWQIREARGYK